MEAEEEMAGELGEDGGMNLGEQGKQTAESRDHKKEPENKVGCGYFQTITIKYGTLLLYLFQLSI